MLRWLLMCAALVLAACSSDAASQKVTTMGEVTADEAAEPKKTEPSAPSSFETLASYGGRVALPLSGEADSIVIRSQAQLDSFLSRVPKTKVQKGPRNVPSTDPLLTAAPIDFDKHMIVAAVCGSFYCRIEIEGFVKEGDTTVILVRSGGEPDGAEMAQRPIHPGGGDSMGNYKGIKVPRVEGKVAFKVRR